MTSFSQTATWRVMGQQSQTVRNTHSHEMNKYLNSQKRHHDRVDGPQDALWVIGHLGVIKHLNRTRRQDSLTDRKTHTKQLADEILNFVTPRQSMILVSLQKFTANLWPAYFWPRKCVLCDTLEGNADVSPGAEQQP